MSICKNCFHSYVCEQFNEHRECDNQKCHFAIDQFISADLIYRLQEENERLEQNLKEAHIDIREHIAEIESLKTKIKNVYKELERIALMTVETDTKELVGDSNV